MDKEKNKLRRLLNETYTASEVDELHDSLRKAAHSGNVLDELAAEVWEEAAGAQRTTVFAETRSYKEAQHLLNHIQKKNRLSLRNFGYAVMGIAAMLVLALVSVHWLNYMNPDEVKMAEVSTSFGEKKEVMLADGSKVVLNACSRLQYPAEFEGDARKVQLKGQAFFQVARNEEMPFFVETANLQVQVLGTEFDVKAYSDDEMMRVDVQSGKVEVTLPEATFRLKKAEQILVNTISGDFNKKKGNEEVASWRKGSLCFNSTPIRDVARELERIYQCKIQFNEGQEFLNLISGEHDNPNLESVLESLRYVSGVKYRTLDNGTILIYK